MATVPKYTRTLYIYNLATHAFVSSANRAGTTIGNGTYTKKYVTNERAGADFTMTTSDWFLINSDTFYQGATFSVLNYLKQSVFNEFIQNLKTFINNGSTGTFYLSDNISDPRALIMWGDGTAYTNGCYCPDFSLSIQQNQLDSVSGERYITGQWYFYGDRVTAYNSTTNKFTRASQQLASGNMTRATTLDNAIYKTLQEIFDKFIRHALFTPAPNPTYTTLASGDRNVTGRNANQTSFMAIMRGCEYSFPNFSRGAMWKHMNAWTTGGSWTSAGNVDPTDPNETPTPIIPPDPDPVPTPDPWFPPEPNPDPSDPISPPSLPGIGGVGTGFYHVYNPTTVDLRLIASAFWTTNVIQQIVNYFTNPLETILGLGIIPVKPETGSRENVKFGLVDSEVTAPVVTSDYKLINCGSRYLAPYYNSYLDYEPYTKMSMYIPYIGEFDMNPDEITGKTVQVYIYINVTTGDLVGIVTANGTIVYTSASNCFRQLPITQGDMSQVIQAAISAVTTIASAASAGAASEGAMASHKKGATAQSIKDAQNKGAVSSMTTFANEAPLVGDIMSAKLHYHRAGQIGTGSGQLAYQKPYLTIIRPNLMLPDGAEDGANSNLKAYKGYPCNQIIPLVNADGYTVLEDARLSIPGATEAEIAEILDIMKGGYIA